MTFKIWDSLCVAYTVNIRQKKKKKKEVNKLPGGMKEFNKQNKIHYEIT